MAQLKLPECKALPSVLSVVCLFGCILTAFTLIDFLTVSCHIKEPVAPQEAKTEGGYRANVTVRSRINAGTFGSDYVADTEYDVSAEIWGTESYFATQIEATEPVTESAVNQEWTDFNSGDHALGTDLTTTTVSPIHPPRVTPVHIEVSSASPAEVTTGSTGAV